MKAGNGEARACSEEGIENGGNTEKFGIDWRNTKRNTVTEIPECFMFSRVKIGLNKICTEE